ncbi:hypothetical protein ACFWHR_12290 [Leucobacter sp. NPDC058333]|uniref:hypothetical protein n=1 Tax=Leucobacter sp. NPDC058333 TaxID=3346450 RepID=UPI003658D0DA
MKLKFRAARRTGCGTLNALLRTGAIASLALALTGCNASIPADPNGTLARVSSDELRVGIAIEPGLSESGNPPAGPLAELAIEYAASIDATPSWQTGGEETLVGMLENEKIDIAFGHFTPETPWLDRAAVSRSFVIDNQHSEELVALMPLGENALLSNFETFLDETERSQ